MYCSCNRNIFMFFLQRMTFTAVIFIRKHPTMSNPFQRPRGTQSTFINWGCVKRLRRRECVLIIHKSPEWMMVGWRRDAGGPVADKMLPWQPYPRNLPVKASAAGIRKAKQKVNRYYLRSWEKDRCITQNHFLQIIDPFHLLNMNLFENLWKFSFGS